MSVYVIIKRGIYMQGVYGIFFEKEIAIENCDLCKANDTDAYHTWEVIKLPEEEIPSKEEIRSDGFSNTVYSIKGRC